ncbi:hypothetical protein DITRI_Ditri06bG0031300 [Diplodiscus trichospermus]
MNIELETTTGEQQQQEEEEEALREGQGMKKIMRVMVGIDDSDDSLYALQWTLNHLFHPITAPAPPETDEEARFLITLVHVHQDLPPYSIPVGPAASAAFYIPSSVEASVKKHEEQISKALLSRALAMCKDKRIKAETLILEGDPKEKICQTTEQTHVDLLILGNRNLGKIKRAFLWSVSDYCAHHANCPVLIVKPSKEATMQRQGTL